jgi:hypothetical protein
MLVIMPVSIFEGWGKFSIQSLITVWSIYVVSCPPPIQNRDFVLQRSWLATPKKISILNHSITHKDLPPKKYFVRGISYITGFFFTNAFSQPYLTAKLFCIGYVIEPLPGKSKGLTLAYVSATDPRGAIPTWAVNKGTQYFAPKVIEIKIY